MPHRETPAEQLVFRWSFFAVYAAAIGAVAWVWWSAGGGAVAQLGKLALTSLLAVGHFIIFVPTDLYGGPWTLALMVWMIDVLVAFALASGLSTLERAPVLGGWLRRARGRAVEVLEEYPRLERMAFFGVAVFVFLPIASTGAVTGSFAARIVGLSRLSGVLAIAFGAAGTTAIFALLATYLGQRGEEILESPLVAAATLACAGVLAWLAFQKVKALLRK